MAFLPGLLRDSTRPAARIFERQLKCHTMHVQDAFDRAAISDGARNPAADEVQSQPGQKTEAGRPQMPHD